MRACMCMCDGHTIASIVSVPHLALYLPNFASVRFKQGNAAPYVFQSYEEVARRIDNLASGTPVSVPRESIELTLCVNRLSPSHPFRQPHPDARTALMHEDLCPQTADGMRLLGLYMKNCPEWVIADQAAFTIQAASVPLYDTLGPDSVGYVINQTELATVVCGPQVRESVLGLIMIPSGVFTIDPSIDPCNHPPKTRSWRTWWRPRPSARPSRRPS